jgi:hypothetical protein
MKRALYEWGSILFAGIAVICLVCWAASKLSDRATGAVNLDGRTFVEIRDGTLVCSNKVADYDYFFDNEFDKPRDRRLMAPGFRFRSVSWGNVESDRFSIELSLLIPGCVGAILGALFFWRYRRATLPASKPPDL